MERLRSGQYCSPECKSEAKQKEDQLALESLSLFGPRTRSAEAGRKPKSEKPKPKPAEPADPAWGGMVGQDVPSFRDAPIRALGFPPWIPPPASTRKKTIEDYIPVVRVPDDVLIAQERALTAAARWVPIKGTNPENADGYRSDFRSPLVAPATALPKRRRGLPHAPGVETAAPQASVPVPATALSPHDAIPPSAGASRPRLQAQPYPPDWQQLTTVMEQDSAELEQFPIRAQTAAEAPPIPPAPTRPKVDAQRIVRTFPAMMQAGLVRVEPGFATAVLELRPISAPAPKAGQLAPCETTGSSAIPSAAAWLSALLWHAQAVPLDARAACSPGVLRCAETAPDQPQPTPLIPVMGRVRMVATRSKPEVRVKLRYLPMPFFQLPSPLADWSA
ncbi:MAG: hypothetical protein JNK48_14240 [Bryobacterales bacterium]|nr:hypothetical protein [Bryobacterales bacterium]